jgi:hypothetical protein
MNMLKTSTRVILFSIWSSCFNPIFAQDGSASFNGISAYFNIAQNNEARSNTKLHFCEAWIKESNSPWEWRLGLGSVTIQELETPGPKGSRIAFWELGPYGMRKQLGAGFSIGASCAWYFGPDWNAARRDGLYKTGPGAEISFEKTICINEAIAIQVRTGHRWNRGISVVVNGSAPRENLGTYFPEYPGSFFQVSFGIGEWDVSRYRFRRSDLWFNKTNLPHNPEEEALPNTDEIQLSNEPPILSVDPSTIEFTDANKNQSLAGNGALDAMDRAELSFIIENTGPGPGRNLYADVSISGATDGLTWVSPWAMPDISPGASEEASSYIILSDRKTVDGVIEVTIEVKEPNGFSPEPFKIEIETRAYRAPKLEVVDFTSSLSTWKPNTPIGLDILVQNTGIGTAHDLSVELTLPDAVNCYSNNTSVEVASLAPGETIPITYDMIVPRNFDQSRVQANLTVTETFGDYGTNWTHGFPFEGGSSNGAVVSIEATAVDGEVSTERAALIKNNSKPSDVSFNQVPKDIIVTTVAVLPIDGKNCNGEMISGQDIASFTEGSLLGLYNVVERRNLERVLDEQKLALSGLIYERSAVEAGCNVGAQGIIFTEYGCLTGQETIQLKLVDCQTSELYWSATGVNATAKETLDKVREELTKNKEE